MDGMGGESFDLEYHSYLDFGYESATTNGIGILPFCSLFACLIVGAL